MERRNTRFGSRLGFLAVSDRPSPLVPKNIFQSERTATNENCTAWSADWLSSRDLSGPQPRDFFFFCRPEDGRSSGDVHRLHQVSGQGSSSEIWAVGVHRSVVKLICKFQTSRDWIRINVEVEGLFILKKGVRILNPQKKNPWMFFLDFFRSFRNFFLGSEDFINEKGFKHWIRGVVHSQIRYRDFKSSKKILGFIGNFLIFRILKGFSYRF